MSNLLNWLSRFKYQTSFFVFSSSVTSLVQAQAPSNNSLLDGLNGTGLDFFSAPTTNVNGTLAASSGIPKLVGYNKNDISITFHFDKPSAAGLIVMNLDIVNSSAWPISEFYLQAAVPKSMQLDIMAASSTNIEANGGSIQQVLKVNNPNKAVLKMRLKISFSRNGQPCLDQGEVSNFPPELLQ